MFIIFNRLDGAPGTIRTSDPQIRSLVPSLKRVVSHNAAGATCDVGRLVSAIGVCQTGRHGLTTHPFDTLRYLLLRSA